MQAPSEVSRVGSVTVSRRRLRVSSWVASARARPMWPWLARAAWAASPGSTPTRSRRNAVTCSADGVVSVTRRDRDRMVGSTSSGCGAHRIHTVLWPGSSIALSSALLARSWSRSASSTTITCHRLRTGSSEASRTQRRASSTEMMTFSVRLTVTSGWEPASTLRHSSQCAAPGLGALQGRGEGDRGVGAARPGRPGEEPGVGHALAAGGGRRAWRRRAAGRRASPRRVTAAPPARWCAACGCRRPRRPGPAAA